MRLTLLACAMLALFFVAVAIYAAEGETKEKSKKAEGPEPTAPMKGDAWDGEGRPIRFSVRGKNPDDGEGKAPRTKRRPRTLMQACKKESKKLCKEGSAIDKCLQANLDQIEDDVCKSWVTARGACLKDAETSSKCEKKESPRACLRKLGPKDVSDECGDSDFFKAVQMYTRWRRRHEFGKKDGAKAIVPKEVAKNES